MKKKSNTKFEESPPKKAKLESDKKVKKDKKIDDKPKPEKSSKFTKSGNKPDPRAPKDVKAKKFPTKGKPLNKNDKPLEKPEDWSKFKKEKKDLKVKRKQGKGNFDVITRAKVIGEKLRQKTLKGGEEERNKLINELHTLLKGTSQYEKFVLAHDTARIVQWLLKYSSDIVTEQISKELIPVSIQMLQSKYGIFCVKRLLKYGSPETRSAVIDKMMGHAIKLCSHTISAPIVETAFTIWASPLQKQYLIQEFYGDLYKKSKDKNVKHITDTYKDNPSLKQAILGSVKENINKVLNKGLLDSALVQSVIAQYLTVCSEENRAELITQLASHIVVISNSRDGAKAAMQCIIFGTNKDKKVIMKTLKEHVVELSKHEHGHSTVISLLDNIDDTVLLHKIILSEILKNARDLAVEKWGRKVLLYLVDPTNNTIFHPVFQKELQEGRESSSSKKDVTVRRQEILDKSIDTLLELVTLDTDFWLSNPSLALEMVVIVNSGKGEELVKAYRNIVNLICKDDWKIKENDETETLGIEHAGMHQILKKLAQHDKVNGENGLPTFGATLIEQINDNLLEIWLKLNRGCFLLVTVFENGTSETQQELKTKLNKHKKLLKGQSSTGAKILLKKIT